MAKIEFHIATPSAELYCADADMVILPSADGDMGVLAGHSPVIALLRPGTIIVQDNGTQERIFIAGGFMEVHPEKATVLAEQGMLVSEININDAKSELTTATTEAKKAIAQAKIDAIQTPYY